MCTHHDGLSLGLFANFLLVMPLTRSTESCAALIFVDIKANVRVHCMEDDGSVITLLNTDNRAQLAFLGTAIVNFLGAFNLALNTEHPGADACKFLGACVKTPASVTMLFPCNERLDRSICPEESFPEELNVTLRVCVDRIRPT